MGDDLALLALLVVTMVLALALVLASTATLGRKLADLEYQDVAGIDGVRRIQAWINVRTHANRTLLGMAFLTTGVLALTDAPILWRTWIGRILFIIVLGAYAYSSVKDWLDERKQVHLLLDEQRAMRVSEDAATVKQAREHKAGEPSSLIVGHVYPAAEIGREGDA